MEHHPILHQMGSLSIKVKAPHSEPERVPKPVREITLKFRVEIKCYHLLVAPGNVITSLRRHKFRELPFAIHPLPVHILDDRADDDALRMHLSVQFQNYSNSILDAKKVADAIKDKWIEIQEKGNSNMFGRVFPLTITLKLWRVVTFPDEHLWHTSEDGMVPTHENAIKKMLKRVEFKGVEDGDQNCVICFEGIIGMAKKKSSIVEMPCLHVFHEQCIKKWLKNSHYCPMCRLQMPTK